jgi:hypothetical protein
VQGLVFGCASLPSPIIVVRLNPRVSRGLQARSLRFKAGTSKLRKIFGGIAMISVLIGVLIIVVIGAICFWAIEKFVRDSRLANLLKLLVVLICLAAILQRVLPMVGIGGL